MSLASVAASSNPQRPKAFAVRSFPTFYGSATTAEAFPATAGNFIGDKNVPPSPLVTPPVPTSCGPGTDLLSYRGKIFKPPVAFAIRKFPKGCGPLAASIPKRSDEGSIDVARTNPEEGIDEKDAEKSNRQNSQTPDFVEGDRKFEGSKAITKVEEIAIRKFPKGCGPLAASIAKPSDEASIDIARTNPEEGIDEKDAEKSNRQNSQTPDFVEGDRKFEGSKAITKVEEIAIRKFPKGCGPLAASIAKPSDEASIDIARTNPEEGIDEKDAEKSNRRNSQTPDFVEGDRKFEGSKAITKVEEIAIRKFPKGCGPLAASIAKPSDEASIDIVRTNPEEGIDEKDAEKSNRQNSQTPDFVEGDKKFEGSEASTKVEEMEQKLRDFVKRIPEERSRLGKISENALDEKSLGGEDVEKPNNKKSSVIPDLVKDGKRFEKMEDELADDVRKTSNEGSVLVNVFKNSAVGTSLGGKEAEKPNRKSPLTPDFVKDVRRFYKAERSESKNKVEDMKEKLNNVVRRISKEGNELGKSSASDVAGRSLGEKDGKEPNRKRSLMPDSVENGRDEGGQLLEVRGDRLIVLALMAATRCPWMQGKGKSSIGFQSRQKKPRSRASG